MLTMWVSTPLKQQSTTCVTMLAAKQLATLCVVGLTEPKTGLE